MSKRIDRTVFARAIATGKTTKDAIAEAGSKARSHGAMTAQAQRLLSEPEVQDMVTEFRAEAAEETRDVWRDAVDVAHGIMMDDEAKNSDRLKAVDLFAKIGGHYAPEKHEHTINTLADLLEEVGEVGDSDA